MPVVKDLPYPCFLLPVSSQHLPMGPPSFLPTHTEHMVLSQEVKHEGTQSLGLLAVEKILEEGRKSKEHGARAGRGGTGEPELGTQLAPC